MKKNISCFFFIYFTLSLLNAVEFKFIVIGDTRPPFGTNSYQTFDKQIELINSLNPDFIINVGDLIYGYGTTDKDKPWDEYNKIISKIKCKYYQIPGNHDIYSKEGEEIYSQKFKKLYYSFNYLNSHFVLLDNSERSIWGYIGDKQFEWLKNDLLTNKSKNIYIFMHFPLWDKKRSQSDKKLYEFWQNKLHPLFKAYKVKAVFGGHMHSYGPTQEYDGIKHFITGRGGAELAKWFK